MGTIELRTLGLMDLRHGDRELRGVLQQPKRLALLTYLAVAGRERFCRRDTLLGLFWPELDGPRARHALSQALHLLGRTLGAGAVERRGREDLRVRPERVWCDRVAYERALAEGDAQAAVELYRGDFLNGFFLPDAPVFEQWVEGERASVKTRAAQAGWTVAERCAAQGQTAEATQWGRWAAALEPYDDAAIQKLVRLLDLCGDRSGAVLAYETFAARLSREMELDPAPETLVLVDAVRARRDPVQEGPTSVAGPTTEPMPTVEPEAPVARQAPTGGRSPTPALPRPPGVRRSDRRVGWTGLGLVLLATTAWAVCPQPHGSSPTEASASAAPDGVAHELYLAGQFLRSGGDFRSLERAVELLEQSILIDPSYAPARASLAVAYAHLAAYAGAAGGAEGSGALLRAREAANDALVLSEAQADAHLALAHFHHWYGWDWPAAEGAYARAVELDPTSAEANHWFALFRLDQGRLDEALALMRRARDLDPSSPAINRNLGYVLYCAGRLAEAAEQLRLTIELASVDPLAIPWLRNVYLKQGLEDEAFEAQVRHAELREWSSHDLDQLRRTYHARGWIGVWELMLAHATARSSRVAPTVFARLHAELGRTDDAFLWLDRAFQERAIELLRLKADPIFEPLRPDPRYDDLLQRMGLPSD